MKISSKLMLTTAVVVAFSTGGAFAADLSIPAQPAPPVVAAPTNWDGPYIGASIGYGWGTSNLTYNPNPAFNDNASPNGWLIGAQLGYNFHLADQLVAGVEGNIDWVNLNDSFANNPADNFRVNWEGSIRARLGVDVANILPYIEAGVAFANADANLLGVSTNNTHTGWTAGVGVEFMVAQQLSINAEYRYSDFGSQDFGSNANSIHLTDNTFRLGLNYHF
ncbi:MAG TPA: outer membrane protein [Devosiaceae bacterium]|nr:outer membrane protein [Devosiaceae bacterium]